jgi:hypothetical protein
MTSAVLKTKRGPEVGIGLGPGRATLDFCRTFSSLLAGYPEPVKLKLVAISAGCPADEPELEDLVRIAGQKNKHVILIARQCGICGRTRAQALRPRSPPAVRLAWAGLQSLTGANIVRWKHDILLDPLSAVVIIIALGSTKSYNLINPFTPHRGVSAGSNLRFDPFSVSRRFATRAS